MQTYGCRKLRFLSKNVIVSFRVYLTSAAVTRDPAGVRMEQLLTSFPDNAIEAEILVIFFLVL